MPDGWFCCLCFMVAIHGSDGSRVTKHKRLGSFRQLRFARRSEISSLGSIWIDHLMLSFHKITRHFLSSKPHQPSRCHPSNNLRVVALENPFFLFIKSPTKRYRSSSRIPRQGPPTILLVIIPTSTNRRCPQHLRMLTQKIFSNQ